MCKVSVIIPVWNTWNLTRDAVKSVTSQTMFSEMECIVVDDGSESIQKIDGISVFRQEHKGVSAARNLGLTRASGKYIFFLDSDDVIFRKDTIESLYRTAEVNNSDIVCSCFLDMINRKKACIYPEKNVEVSGTDIISKYNFFLYPFNPSMFFVKKCFLDAHQIRFDEDIFMEDMLFFFDECCFSEKMYVSEIVSIVKKSHSMSVMKNYKQYSHYYVRACSKIYDRMILRNFSHDIIGKCVREMILSLEDHKNISVSDVYEYEKKILMEKVGAVI